MQKNVKRKNNVQLIAVPVSIFLTLFLIISSFPLKVSSESSDKSDKETIKGTTVTQISEIGDKGITIPFKVSDPSKALENGNTKISGVHQGDIKNGIDINFANYTVHYYVEGYTNRTAEIHTAYHTNLLKYDLYKDGVLIGKNTVCTWYRSVFHSMGNQPWLCTEYVSSVGIKRVQNDEKNEVYLTYTITRAVNPEVSEGLVGTDSVKEYSIYLGWSSTEPTYSFSQSFIIVTEPEVTTEIPATVTTITSPDTTTSGTITKTSKTTSPVPTSTSPVTAASGTITKTSKISSPVPTFTFPVTAASGTITETEKTISPVTTVNSTVTAASGTITETEKTTLPVTTVNSTVTAASDISVTTPTTQISGTGTTTNKPVQQIGDISGDGKLDILDLIMLKQYFLGNRMLSEDEKKAADINNDGKINVLDFIKVIEMIFDI